MTRQLDMKPWIPYAELQDEELCALESIYGPDAEVDLQGRCVEVSSSWLSGPRAVTCGSRNAFGESKVTVIHELLPINCKAADCSMLWKATGEAYGLQHGGGSAPHMFEHNCFCFCHPHTQVHLPSKDAVPRCTLVAHLPSNYPSASPPVAQIKAAPHVPDDLVTAALSHLEELWVPGES
jgi:hypothetical protein